ncbi:MAG TPA: thioesterase domain-containing protein [Rugosimonospora sp.]|nr:thioesterase domain-containing protein [Rugosimonospora sp.]
MTTFLAAGDAPTAGDADPPSPPLGGVRLARVRAGEPGTALFLAPGIDGELAELGPLVAAFAGAQEAYAVAPLPEDAEQRPVTTMERMAELAVAAVRQVQPSGPYRLGGYSFGALLALEMAQQLCAAGEPVEALFLIEALYDERYWPRGIWLRAMVRRTGRQLLRIVRMNPVRAAGELRLRGVRLVRRVVRRGTDTPEAVRMESSDEASVRGRAYSAISGYRPRFYPGHATLIASAKDRHFGCDTTILWTGYAEKLEVIRVDGDHVTVMQQPTVASVASIIDHRLALARAGWPGLRPRPGFARPMILTTMRWFAAARLAHALVESGFTVSACRPRAHALELVDGLAADCRLRRVGRLRSLIAAIQRADPDIILADDERALVLLRRLHARARTVDPALAALLARSLGAVEDWPSITSRTGLATVAEELRIPVPPTAVVPDAASLAAWGMPLVLKTDGSWGGRGVAIVPDAGHLPEAWHRISNPPALPRALKRLLVNAETESLAAWLRRARPVVNAQRYVAGHGGIATVASLDGEVLAVVCLDVVEASEARGPAAVVRIVDHPGMAEAATRLVARFRLTGFSGFDFILTDSGEAQLIELNPRVTPTSYLLVEGDYQRSRTIALFPAESLACTTLGLLDQPVRARSLLRLGERIAARQDWPVARMARHVMRRLSASRY